MRAIVPLLILLLMPCIETPAWAKPERTTADIRQDLRSDDDVVVAHAVHAASEGKMVALVPDLRRVLLAREAPTTRAQRLVVSHLLDAMIRLNARVPMEVLGRFEEGALVPVLILAVRTGREAYPFLRRVLAGNASRDATEATIAAGNILFDAADRQVVSLSLRYVRPEISISVIDHDRLTAGPAFCSAIGIGCGRAAVPKNYPPLIRYRLALREDPYGATLLAHGAVESVWFERHVERRKSFWFGSSTSSIDELSEVVFSWFAALLKAPVKSLPLKRTYCRSHRWTDAPTYLAFARETEREVQQGVTALLDQLVAAGLLTETEREKVSISPRHRVWDGRDNKQVPLPKR